MNECRNCSSSAVKDLGAIGEVAPFFLKRVLNMEYGFPPSRRPLKRLLQRWRFLAKLFDRVYRKSSLVEMQICTACLFIQTKVPFPDDSLAKLYADYRSDSYNRERIYYEPEYASIAAQIGSSAQEVQSRTVGLTDWLRKQVDIRNGFSMLDYGGADGKFLPNLPGRKYVFDISDIPPAQGIVRVKNESDLGRYSYVQVAHVLEHVSNPLALATRAASFLEPSGFLYIEVPQDLSDAAIRLLFHENAKAAIPVHEHINQYCSKSVTELLRAAELSCESVETEVVDLGWSQATIIRGLGRKH